MMPYIAFMIFMIPLTYSINDGLFKLFLHFPSVGIFTFVIHRYPQVTEQSVEYI